MHTTQPVNPMLRAHNVGSEAWWQGIAKTGSPLQMPIDEEATFVSFIYRGEAGCNTNINSVYIDLYSKTPHPTKQLTYFTQIHQTDVWYWETTLPSDWLGSYFIMPATQQQSPPTATDKQSMRQWWIQLMATNAQADPLNLQPSYSTASGIALSTLCLNDHALHFPPVSTPPLAKVDSKQWQSKILNNARTIWLYQTGVATTQALPLILLFDGQYFAEQLPIYCALDELTANKQLPAAVYLFIDSMDQRAQELACEPSFYRAIEQELLPWLSEQYTFSNIPSENILVGQSLGGLCSLYGGLFASSRFASVIAQSGAFWWPEVDNLPAEGALFERLETHQIAPINIVLTAGCYEQEMLQATQIMAQTLKDKGHNIHYHSFSGGHDWLCWRQDLLDSLELIFKAIHSPLNK